MGIADETMDADHNNVNVANSLLEGKYVQALAHGGLQLADGVVETLTGLDVNGCFTLLKIAQQMLSGNVEDGAKGLKALVREQIIDAESAQKNWEEGNYLRLAYNVF